MKISRWLAEIKPSKEQIEAMFKDEGLEYFIEEYPSGSHVQEHRHPFDEVRMVVKGTMRYNVAGNEFILREGDRVDLPSNTRHWTKTEGDSPTICLVANRIS